ncbi:helix-turn-helix domain protein [Anaeromyxobacter dehalogenans 2CP-1]|uniref:Helix-turn-helix domain protein n=1 Tax=Anaeromyxobacter dehalogenans (strain ATCC BAA-258 / DSM 21875 / 2CP-1) TaxID=455488 RepID=B8JF97_ANAD2|nr:XRE family transcriptional regulator [Anaeromyxobacter dehalogenans]ACL64454.1 helix-turn-helix domain protein [Anaeromyxobacter dehalogenans 2CP-1]
MISSQKLGERIAFARKNANLTQADLAAKIGVARTTLVAVEKGERRPSNAELIKLAGFLKVSVHDLLREHAVTGEVSPRFRMTAPPGNATEANAVVKRLQSLGSRYAELEQLLGLRRIPAPLESIEAYRADRAGAGWVSGAPNAMRLLGQDAARTVRNALDVGDGPALSLEQQLELQAGLRIFHLPMPNAIAAMLIWSDELGACVAINRGHPLERRRWSLSHETAHFLRDREEGEVLPLHLARRTDPAEVFAESFAQEFLMPSGAIARRFSERVRANGRFTIADILWMAHLYQVSFQAMTLRLEDLELLPSGTYEGLAEKKFKASEAAESLGLQSITQPRPELLPDRFISLAAQAYEKELISETEFASYLEVDRVTARRVYQSRRQSQVEDGMVVELDLGREFVTQAGHEP